MKEMMIKSLSRGMLLAALLLLTKFLSALGEDAKPVVKVEFEVQLAPGKSGSFVVEVRRFRWKLWLIIECSSNSLCLLF